MYNPVNGWTKVKMIEQIKLKNNGKKSKNELDGRCMYKTPNGNHCAIGCFIPDSHRALRFEGNVLELLIEYPELRTNMPFFVM